MASKISTAISKIVSRHKLPEGFVFFEHPSTRILFAEYLPYRTNGRPFVVPRQPPSAQLGSTLLDDQAKASVLDAKHWLAVTEKTRGSKYSANMRERLAPPIDQVGSSNPRFDDPYWMLDF